MSIVDPWNGHAGETTWDTAALVIEELADNETHDRRTITDRLIDDHNAHPGTVKSVIQQLARFGAIDRPGKHNIRLTPLGARWWQER